MTTVNMGYDDPRLIKSSSNSSYYFEWSSLWSWWALNKSIVKNTSQTFYIKIPVSQICGVDDVNTIVVKNVKLSFEANTVYKTTAIYGGIKRNGMDVQTVVIANSVSSNSIVSPSQTTGYTSCNSIVLSEVSPTDYTTENGISYITIYFKVSKTESNSTKLRLKYFNLSFDYTEKSGGGNILSGSPKIKQIYIGMTNVKDVYNGLTKL